jgi:hypothetical protein
MRGPVAPPLKHRTATVPSVVASHVDSRQTDGTIPFVATADRQRYLNGNTTVGQWCSCGNNAMP